MSDINILVDTSEVVGGQKALNDLANTFAKVVTKVTRDQKMLQKALEAPWAAQSAGIDAVAQQMNKTSTTAVRENQRIVASLLGINNGYKSAEDSARAFSVVLENQERSARQVAETINRLNNIGGPKATDNGASFSAMSAEIDRLTQKYNQAETAAKLYETTLIELGRANRLAILDANQHQEAVENLILEYQQFQAGTAAFGNRFAQQAGIAQRSTNQLGVVVQQSGYQIGDFLVQVQSGTNWMVAFGQQATQLVGTLPLLAGSLGVSAGRLIAISTGLGIAIPLITALGAVWMRSSEQNGSATNSIDAYTKAIQTAGSEVESLDTKLRKMRFPDLSDAQAQLQQQIELLKTFQNALATEALSKLSLGRPKQEVDELNAKIVEMANKIKDAQKQYDLIAKKLAEIAVGASEAARFEEKRRQIAEAILAPLRREKELREQAKESAERLRAVIASINGMSVRVSVNFEAAYSNFTDQAMDWLGGTFNKMKDMSQPGYMDSSPRPREAPQNVDFGIEDAGGGGGGGGGGSTTTIENKMEEIYKYLELEEYQIEQEQIAHKQREDILRTALENKMITLEEYNALEKAITEQHNQDLLEIEMRTKNSRLTELSGMFGQLAGIMQAGGSKTAKIAATFGAIEATINSYVAATDALRKATTIPGKIAAYASVLATGLKGVAAIKAAGGVGGGSGGGGGPSSSVTPSAADTGPPQTVYIDSLDPEGLYSGQTLINLFDAFYNENDKRGKVFVVARG